RHLSDLMPVLDALANFADKRSYAKAQDLFRDLTRDRSADLLLHGDLHHDNIIRNGDSWLVIDPHGYQGHPTAETATMIYNPLNGLPAGKPLAETLERRIRIMSEELGDDLRLLQAWCYCKTMLSAAWNVEHFPEQARHEVGIAHLIESLQF
ncbi:MAG TPA: aminoglycoside phosphotransferase family protein, partial [Pseudobdellovibrionaceae bacterium]|nr:aminoglycoside phosphotransferase family protein [Pseudobdellovibrionaceae bacterium]